MKKIIFTLIGIFLMSGIMAQTKMDSWPELKAFHLVMAQTFHPSEEGNLKPIRERSAELEKKAVALAESTIPAEFKKKEIIEAVNQLRDDSRKLNELIVSKGSDEAVSKSLSELHNTFHEIVEKCSKGDDKSEHKEH